MIKIIIILIMLSIIISNIIKISIKYYRYSVNIITLNNRLNFATTINTANIIFFVTIVHIYLYSYYIII
jgi:hypothetical protein